MSDTDPIAFYVPSLTVGGAERVTVTVANGLAERGYDIHLIVPYYEGAFVGDIHDSVTVFDLQTPKVPGIGIGASLPRLVSYFRRQTPSIVFAQMLYASDICLLAHRLTGSDAMFVPTVHNTVGINEPLKEQFVQWLAKGLSGHADQFVTVSDGAADSVVDHLDVPREKVSVLHNPIPVTEIRTQACEGGGHQWIADDEYDVVLAVGRLAPQKNYPLLLRAFQRLHEGAPETRAIIIGRGPDREELEALAADLGIEDSVDFLGYVDNPYAFMSSADVLAMSSIHEGLPTVLLEALACGCPVVSTDCPSGPRTILDDGTYGPLVDVGDVDGFAAALEETLADPPERTTLVERARDFAPEEILDEYVEFIESQRPVAAPPEPNL